MEFKAVHMEVSAQWSLIQVQTQIYLAELTLQFAGPKAEIAYTTLLFQPWETMDLREALGFDMHSELQSGAIGDTRQPKPNF